MRGAARATSAILVVAALLAVGCTTGSSESADTARPLRTGTPLAERPRNAVEVRPTVYFRDLPTMVATSTVVVQGRVVEVAVVGDIGQDENPVEVHSVALEVTGGLYGPVEAGETLTIEDTGILSPYSLVGDVGTYFLVQRPDRTLPTFRLVNPQGMYLSDGRGGLQASGSVDELSSSLEAVTQEDLVSQILSAVEMIWRGEVLPAGAP